MENTTERTLAMAIYLSSFFTAVLGPLIIWLIKKDESSFIDYHGKEYFNFFISYSIYAIASSILMLVLIGFILLPIVGLGIFIFTIIGAIKAYEGQLYRIPFIIRFLK